MLLSYHLDVSSGATIVLVGAALFAVVFAVTGSQGRRRAAGLSEHEPPALVGLPRTVAPSCAGHPLPGPPGTGDSGAGLGGA